MVIAVDFGQDIEALARESAFALGIDVFDAKYQAAPASKTSVVLIDPLLDERLALVEIVSQEIDVALQNLDLYLRRVADKCRLNLVVCQKTPERLQKLVHRNLSRHA